LRRVKRRIPNPTPEMLIGRKPLGTTTVRYVVMRVGLKAGIRCTARHTGNAARLCPRSCR
jgi:hypothetical protein